MKKLGLLMVVFAFFGCNSSTSVSIPAEVAVIAKDTAITDKDSIGIQEEVESDVDTINYDYATYFLVIADTSQDYFQLRKKMMNIHSKLNIPIDTMGRFFNKEKGEIVLPDDDEDEIYAGSYFPRRFPSNTLSLEYLDFYQEKAGEKTIALVAGIFENEDEAISALKSIRILEQKSYTLKSEIFIGCMH